ncbi:MAG: efflux RND transporter periplasmic adaptor subunit [Proteobacteria bacterium]|nr:efflux RND transporter periplasmic adaptor subunit [Pseudomonadota bacterium]
MKKVIVFLLLGIMCFVLFFFWKNSELSSGNRIAPPFCQTVKVETGNIATTISGRGKLTTNRFAQIQGKGNSRVVKMLVKEGDSVESGSCLAMIEADSQYDLELYNARWGAITNEQNIQDLKNNLKEQEKLYEEGFLPLKAVKDTQRQLSQLETQKKILTKKIKVFENKLGKTAGGFISPDDGKTLDDSCVKAPFAGTVMQIYKKEGDTVMMPDPQSPESNGGTILILADLSAYIVEYDVSEIDLGKVKVDQAVSLVFDSFPEKTYRGVVDKIANVASISRKERREDQRDLSNYLTQIRMVDTGPELKQGLSCRVSIEVGHRENALLAPVKAIIKDEQGEYVFALSGSSIDKMSVTAGIVSDDLIEVLAGLKEGDTICSEPFIVMEQQALARQKEGRSWIEKIFN